MVIVHDGKKFDALMELHRSDGLAGHAKGKTLRAMVWSEHGASITQAEQALFVKLCQTCARRLPKLQTGPAGKRPIVSKLLGSRGLIDMIELQAYAADNFGYKCAPATPHLYCLSQDVHHGSLAWRSGTC